MCRYLINHQFPFPTLVYHTLTYTPLTSAQFSGRPLRTLKTPYLNSWEVDRKDLITELCDAGTVPYNYYIKKAKEEGKDFSIAKVRRFRFYPFLIPNPNPF